MKYQHAEATELFEQAVNLGSSIRYPSPGETPQYQLLSHNCVTVSSKILNIIDPQITSPNMIWPWDLDEKLRKYRQTHPDCIVDPFFAKYTEIADREFFSFARKHHWTGEQASTEDIIKHAYGKGERTKTTLLELGWVTETKDHILVPTNSAPEEFRQGLLAYNQDYQKMLSLRLMYKSEGSFLDKAKIYFKGLFEDTPDFATAYARIESDAEQNPQGISARVLAKWTERQEPATVPDGGSPQAKC